MKIQEMLAIKNSRSNVIAFLHCNSVEKIYHLSDRLLNPSKLSFYSLCDGVISLYETKQITNKQATSIFNILMKENTQFKTEQFRQDGYGNILQYSDEHNAYLFYCKGGNKEFNKLIKEHGEYI